MTIVAQSCHRVDPDPDMRQAIGFSILETKAGATADNIAASGSAFIVRGSASEGSTWASGTAATIFGGTTVTSNGTKWSYSPLKYWYPSHAYHFRAVWPASAFGTSGATYTDGLDGNASITGFTVGTNADVDLLLSDLVTATTDEAGVPTSGITSGKVKLTFGHILSKVNVSVAQPDATADLRINEVKISGMKGSGEYSGTSTSGTWTLIGSALSHSKSFSTAQMLDGTNFSPIWGTDGLFLIPQSLSGITLSVTFQEGASGTPQTLTANLGTSSWLQGKDYEYKATLTAKQIEFTVKVVDWVDGSTVTLQK